MIVFSFKKALGSGKFVVTSEVAPLKGTNLEKTAHYIDLLKGKVDAMNITDHQSSVMRFPLYWGGVAGQRDGGSPYCR